MFQGVRSYDGPLLKVQPKFTCFQNGVREFPTSFSRAYDAGRDIPVNIRSGYFLDQNSDMQHTHTHRVQEP
jgi:hypothetical protein